MLTRPWIPMYSLFTEPLSSWMSDINFRSCSFIFRSFLTRILRLLSIFPSGR